MRGACWDGPFPVAMTLSRASLRHKVAWMKTPSQGRHTARWRPTGPPSLARPRCWASSAPLALGSWKWRCVRPECCGWRRCRVLLHAYNKRRARARVFMWTGGCRRPRVVAWPRRLILCRAADSSSVVVILQAIENRVQKHNFRNLGWGQGSGCCGCYLKAVHGELDHVLRPVLLPGTGNWLQPGARSNPL